MATKMALDLSNLGSVKIGHKSPSSPSAKDEKQEDFDRRIINRAIILSGYALAEPEQARPFGAIVVRNTDRKLISECVADSAKTKDPTAHGELLAIRAACKFLGKETLEDCTIYASCEPCPMCSALINISKLSRVVYACAWQEIPDVIDMSPLFEYVSKPIGDRSTPAVQIEEPKAADIIRQWYHDKEDDDDEDSD